MKNKNKIRIASFCMLLVLMLTVLRTGNLPSARAQGAWTETPTQLTTPAVNSGIDEIIREKIDEHLLSVGWNYTYETNVSDLNEGWVNISVQYLDADNNPVSEPVLLFGFKDPVKGWLVYAPWNSSEYNTAINQLPTTMMNDETKGMFYIPEIHQQSAPTGGFIFPWSSNSNLMQNAYGDSSHSGSTAIDVNGITDILAAKDGVVLSASDSSNYTGGASCFGDTWRNLWVANNYVLLGHGRAKPDGSYLFYSLYYHLKQGSIPASVKLVGSRVKVGDKIGEMGSTGWSSAPHLHFVVGTSAILHSSTNQYTPCGSTVPVYRPDGQGVAVIQNAFQVQYDFEEDAWPILNGGTGSMLPSKNHLGYNTRWCNPTQDHVIVYEHRDYGGKCEVLSGSDGNLGDNYIGGGIISSALVEPVYDLVLYEQINWVGNHISLDMDTSDFGKTTVGDWNDHAWSSQVYYGVCIQGDSEIENQTCGSDIIPPSGSWTSPGNGQTISSRSVTLSVNASDNAGGSGVQDVRWSAKWNNQWYGLGSDSSSPYSINWDMCTSGVPDGDVELGFEVWDNANNKWVYSEHYTNYHINKSYICVQNPNDTTPPSGSWTSPGNGQTISSQNVILSVNASDNSGGSGVREVRWSAKFNNQWYGVGSDTTSPYSVSWDMCASGVPNGDVELGMEVWDNANNKWVYSEHYSNYHINKNYTCSGNGSGSWETWGWQNKYLAGYDNWHGTVTWDNYPYIWWDFGSGGPFGWGGNEFSLRMQRDVYFPGGDYSFHVDHDDGARVYVDGNLIIDAWWDGNGGHDGGRNLSQGNHQVKVEFYENQGDATLHVLWYGPGYPRPDNNPPDGRITSPANHSATASSPLTITADASDDASGVNRVEFYVWYCDTACNWRLLGTDYSSPYSVTWDWASLSDQHVYLTTHMVDNTGKVREDPGGYVEVDLDRTKPSVSITSPMDWEALNGNQITITANAVDSLSGVGSMQFFAGYNETAGASLQDITQPPDPATSDNSGILIASDVSSQAYWHEIGWDGDGSDGWSFIWDPTGVPDQSGISVFVYAYDRAGNYYGFGRNNLSLYRPPANDDFNSAKQITSIRYNDSGVITGATRASDDPVVSVCGLAPGMASVWYQYTPPVNMAVYLDTFTSDYDTYIAVWTGLRGSLTPVSCNDDFASSNLQSALQVNLTRGTTYYFEIAQWNGWAAAASEISGAETDKVASSDASAQAGGTLNFHVTYAAEKTSWYGGAVVTADQQVVAVGRPHIGSEVTSYGGFSSGSLTQYVPMLFKQMWGSYDSALYIQNADPSNTANISIKYYDSNGTLNCTKTDTIAAQSSKGYWLPSETCLPASWYGGVVVTSDRNIVAVGRPHIGDQVMTYNGFASGGSTMYVPMLFKRMWGNYDSAFYIQNTDPANTANVTIKFYDPNGVLNCTKTDSIPRLSSHGYWLPDETCLPANWYGGVVVTADRNIVAVGRPHMGSEITTYNGFPGGSTAMYAPMLFKDASGGSYDSALYIQNVHATNTANVTIKFYNASGGLTCTKTDTILPGSSKGYWLPDESCLGSSWTGSVKVESSQPVVVIGRPHLGSSVTAYDGIGSGGTSVSVPMLFKQMWGSYDSALYIENVDPSNTANVTTRFYDVNGNLSCVRTDTIGPLATMSYWLPSLTCSP